MNFIPQITADGSFTFYSEDFAEAFHSHHGARREAQEKFVVPTQLPEKAKQPQLAILDICYGLGYNTAAALETIWQINPDCQVSWIGLELDPRVPQAAIAHHLHDQWPDPIPAVLEQLAHSNQARSPNFQGHLKFADARVSLQQIVTENFQADAIFLDPFSPPKSPQLWTVDFFAFMVQCLKPDGRIATYSCAASVRSALQTVGLYIGSTAPCGRRSPGTVASFNPENLPPLSLQEQEHLQTRAAIPYRDPDLQGNRDSITLARQIAQNQSALEPSSHWKKRWNLPQDRLP